jgi:hypothetical protein
VRWNRERTERGFRGGGRRGREWTEIAGIWPAAGVEERGGGRRKEGRWGSARLGFRDLDLGTGAATAGEN